MPNYRGAAHDDLARVPLASWNDTSSVEVFECTTQGGQSQYSGGFSDGKYGYMVKYNTGSQIDRFPMAPHSPSLGKLGVGFESG